MPKELLIADGNVTAQEEFERIFEDMDAQLIFAENGEDALLKIKLYKPDLVIADVTMPNKDGFELCKTVKTNPELKGISFVLLAGIFEDIDRSQQENVGADGVITKPLKGEEILPLVRGLLAAGGTPLRAPGTAGTVSESLEGEDASLDLELPPAIEGLEEAAFPGPGEVSEGLSQPDGDEEAVIELTDVIDEALTAPSLSEERVMDQPLERAREDQAETALGVEELDQISLDGIDLEESETVLELDGMETAEERPSEEVTATEEAQLDGLRRFGLAEEPEHDHLDRDKGAGGSFETMEAELEEEIDRRIDLVLEEEGREEVDTLLDLEGMEDEGLRSPGQGGEVETLSEETTEGESEATVGPEDHVVRIDGISLEAEGAGMPTEDLEEFELLEEEAPGRLGETEEAGGVEAGAVEEVEEPDEESLEPSDQTSKGFADDLEGLSLEDLEGLEETVEELGDLSVEEDVEGLLEEGTLEFGQGESDAEEESFEEGDVTPVAAEAPLEEELEISEVQEASPHGDLDEGVDEIELPEVAPAGRAEAPEMSVREEGEEESITELEEGLEEGDELLEEILEEPRESAGPPTFPKELIREEEVSEAELDAFQKRLRSGLELSPSVGGRIAEPPGDRVESLVRRAVEQVLRNVSESVVPELTRVIVQVASERIEQLVKRVVPDLAETAIKREIERLQKGT